VEQANARHALKQAALDVASDAGLKAANAMVEAAQKRADAARQQVKADDANLKFKQVTAERQERLAKDGAVTEQALDDARAQFEVAQAAMASSAAKMAAAEADLAKARAGVAAAEGEILIARADVKLAAAEVKKIKSMLRYRRIIAPFDGVITERWVDRGAMAQAATSTRSQPLFAIQRIDKVRVFFDVPEPDVPFVQPGKTAVSVQPYGSVVHAIEGKVTRYASALDPATRTMKVEVDLDNPGELLKGGVFARVTAQVQQQATALTIPAEALITEGDRRSVYVVRDGRAVQVPVKTGLDNGTRIEITSGLDERDWIVTTGKGNISAGVQVAAVPEKGSRN
jgi:RND family efflux transporter MFP subunit